jgi:hypothetical protein
MRKRASAGKAADVGTILWKLKATPASPAWVLLTWFGMTAGVSVLATPARFSAPLTTRELAFDLMANVFAYLNKAEFAVMLKTWKMND